MSEEPDPADDLIAELAKLMAQDAQGGERSSEPAPAPAPQPRIVAQQPTPQPAPTIRIPGMAEPAPHQAPQSDPPVQQAAPQSTTPAAGGSRFDFGAAPKAAPSVSLQPLDNWHERFQARVNAPSQPIPPREERQEPSMAAPANPAPNAAQSPASPQPHKPMPSLTALAQHPAPSTPVSHEPLPDLSGELDFSFGRNRHEPPRQEPQPAPPAAAVPEPAAHVAPPKPEPVAAESAHDAHDAHDAIADLIAAEMQAPAAEPVSDPAPAPEPDDMAEAEGQFAAPEPAAASAPEPEPAKPEPAPQAEQPHTTPRPANPLLRPVNFTANKAANDKFVIAPVFGVGTRAAPAQRSQPANAQRMATAPIPVVDPVRNAPEPARAEATRTEPSFEPKLQLTEPANKPQSDAFAEIESLIGEAARVPAENKPAQRASEPQLGFEAPKKARTSKPDFDDHGADEAILAAAAATGAEVRLADDPDQLVPPATGRQDKPAKPVREKAVKPPKAARVRDPDAEDEPRGGGLRHVVGPAVAGTLLLLAGFGLYWVLGMSHTGNTVAPLLSADTTPTKVVPETPPADTSAQQGSVVFNELQGNSKPQAEQLVSRDQTDTVDVAATTPAEETESGLANRKVRTVTVRPDGTIVSSDDGVAGAEMLPVDRPNVPAIPGATDTPSSVASLAATTPAEDTATALPEAGTPTNGTVSPVTAVIPDGQTAALPNEASALLPPDSGNLTTNPTDTQTVATIDPAELDPSAPMPMPTKSGRPTAPIGPTVTATPTTQTVPAGTPAQAVDASPVPTNIPVGAPAYVQLSSQRDEAVARQSLAQIQSRYGSLFGGTPLEIQRIDLGAKGIYYRVRLPAVSLSSANEICNAVKANGGDCFPQN